MKNIFTAFFSVICLPFLALAQTAWTWQELSPMPFKVSNNAVVEAEVGGVSWVYSFAGIDTTKSSNGIHLKAARYNFTTDVWATIAPLPDSLGKIAAGASYVKGKIYIIGGYHVLANGNEISSNKVHVYNPLTNTYEADGADIPVPIDDQVQCIWRDSLIFVITGWSNTNNVPNVQIYDPSLDTWQIGTATPNDNYYKAFGASGTIMGDTILYNGGVRGGFNFATVNFTRMGIIDPTDPTQIIWSLISDNPGMPGYRMACGNVGDKAFWIGGGGVAYNYDGLAYSNGAGVEPLTRILQYNKVTELWDEGLGAPFGVMDLRGIAQISETEWIICGGMESGQQVSNKTYLLTYDPITGSAADVESERVTLFPNPSQDVLFIKSSEHTFTRYRIVTMTGQTLSKGSLDRNQIDIRNYAAGVYFVYLDSGSGSSVKILTFEKE